MIKLYYIFCAYISKYKIARLSYKCKRRFLFSSKTDVSSNDVFAGGRLFALLQAPSQRRHPIHLVVSVSIPRRSRLPSKSCEPRTFSLPRTLAAITVPLILSRFLLLIMVYPPIGLWQPWHVLAALPAWFAGTMAAPATPVEWHLRQLS